MLVKAHVTIQGTKAATWAAMTDFENAAKTIRGIEKIEIVERPAQGLVGLRWRETRLYFGDLATVEKRITDAVDGASYTTRTDMDGFVFLSTTTVAEGSGGVTLTTVHETKPQGFVARVKSLPMLLMKGVIRKALREDLDDIKALVEQRRAPSA